MDNQSYDEEKMDMPQIKTAEFAQLQPGNVQSDISVGMDVLLDVPLSVSVELGRSRCYVKDLLGLTPGSVVELDKVAGEPVDILINGKNFAKGEVVVIDDNFGVRINEIISRKQVNSILNK